MSNYLTANVALNLYWFGRYLERIESTLLELSKSFDEIIDVEKDAGKKLFYKFGIELEYENAKDFLQVATYGEHSSNIYELITQARENAIISRANIETEAFGSVIELHRLIQEGNNVSFTVDCRFIDKILRLISEIWGELTRKLKRDKSDYFIRLGKLVEKVDSHLRLGKNKEFAMVMMDEIDAIVTILVPDAIFTPHSEEEDHEIIIDSINAKINKIISEEQ